MVTIMGKGHAEATYGPFGIEEVKNTKGPRGYELGEIMFSLINFIDNRCILYLNACAFYILCYKETYFLYFVALLFEYLHTYHDSCVMSTIILSKLHLYDI